MKISLGAKGGIGATLVALFFIPLFAFAQVTYERIENFSSSIIINPDSSISVSEAILYDFGGNERHGIYREIPQTFTDTSGKKHQLSFELFSVVDETGKSYITSTTQEDGKFRVRIGDSDVLITGVHSYIITYSVRDAVSFLDDIDELYWNVTGNEWQVPIVKADAEITFPGGASIATSLSHCYEGAFGSKESCATKIIEREDGSLVATFTLSGSVEAGHGLTAGAGFSKGLVTPPPPPFGGPFAPFIPFVLPVLVALSGFFIGYTVWKKKGKDPFQGTIVAEFEPPKELSFLESAYLLNASTKNISPAGIIHLATIGVLRIEAIEEKQFLVFNKKDYKLVRLAGVGSIVDPLDTLLLEALFEEGVQDVLVSKFTPSTFLIKLSKIRSAGARALFEKGFTSNNLTTAGLALLVPIIAFSVLAVASFALSPIVPLLQFLWVGVVLGEVALFIFAYLMPRMTEKGVSVHRALKGLKLYVSVAEKDRLEFHNAPEKTPELFEKLLPYAMLFGVTEIWTKEFEGILTQPPSWYGGAGAWNPALFATQMSAFNSALSASTAASGSGGGGSSGGGGGGGGGGSW